MAAYFESEDCPDSRSGFAVTRLKKATHAMRIFDFVAQRGGRIEIDWKIAKPRWDYARRLRRWNTRLPNEEKVTGQINALFELAHEVKEYSTQNMLNWFLAEQNEGRRPVWQNPRQDQSGQWGSLEPVACWTRKWARGPAERYRIIGEGGAAVAPLFADFGGVDAPEVRFLRPAAITAG